ncbi:MAG: BCCT family transporter [Gammaproteobacteria bacterium]
MEQKQIDWATFGTCLAIILVVCLPLAVFPGTGGQLILKAYDFIATEFGFLYMLAGVAVMVLLAWLAIGRYGRIVLGTDGDKPEFSDYSWAAMLFCAGVGGGLMFWAPVEWAYYFDSPPFGVEPRSAMAADWASTYGIFHWGPGAWCFYCLPTLAIAYPYYVKRVPFLRFSASCHYLIGAEEETGWGRFIDLLFMIALLGGAGSSIGFTTPLIAACISRLTGIDSGFALEVLAVFLCVGLFSISVWLGLRKGIKRLSDINLGLAFALLLFVVIAGPTVFLLKTSVASVGLMLQNFIRMNTWTDAFTDSGFVESWTIWYWAWWIAYGPFVGLFVTRISRGRTIRQVILGMIGYGSLGAMIFYMTLGNYGLSLELSETLSVTAMLKERGQASAVVAILDQLPWPSIAIAVFCVVTIVFTATTYDSASYILASSATRRLEAGDDPARWHRLFWALALAVVPLTLMFIGRLSGDPRAGLTVIQTATLVVSLPILVVGVLMSISLMKQLRNDHG